MIYEMPGGFTEPPGQAQDFAPIESASGAADGSFATGAWFNV